MLETTAQTNEAPAETSVEATTSEVQERPDYIPEKFWDTEKKQVNVENLAKSYIEIDKMRGTMKEKISEEIKKELEQNKLKAVPEKYEVKIPELPDGVEYKIDDSDPLYTAVSEVAKKHGLSQDAFNDLLSAKVAVDLQSAKSHEQELAKLGVNAEARLNRVNTWIDANLDKDSAEAIRSVAVSASVIKALESIVSSTTGAAFLVNEASLGGEEITIDKLREMQSDPRYFDPRKREESFVKKVEEGYKLLYSGNKRGR